jgi:DNA-binding NarL/FixJ family response regulator
MGRLLIVGDLDAVREGIKDIVRDRGGDTTVSDADTAGQALDMVRGEDWNVLVLDMAIGGRGGLDLLKQIKDLRPRLPVLVLSMHAEEQYARRAFKAGAQGYITKDRSRSEVGEAIGKVLTGGRYFTHARAEGLVGDHTNMTDRPLHEALSAREFEVMRLIASGMTVGEIAAALCLSDRTISTCRSRVLEKMRMTTDAALIHYAVANKLVA